MLLGLHSCGDTQKQEADRLLEQIRTEYADGRYKDALATIDTLRKKCPEAIDQRKEALKVYQDAALKMAQDELAAIDTTLQQARHVYERLKTTAENHKQEGVATAEELTAVTMQKLKVDSLQNRFDAWVAKVRFIHRKQKEN